MKKTIIFLLLSFAFLSNAQTLIKFNQLERAGGASSVVVSTGTNGVLSYTPTFPISKWTNDIPYSTRETPTAVKVSNYTAVPGDFIPCDVTAGSFTITLPTAPAEGSTIGAKITSTLITNIIVVKTGGADVFNKAGGATSGTITLPGQAMHFQYKSSTAIWYVVYGDIPLSQLDARYTGTVSGGYVPYTGATGSVNLGTNTFSAGNSTFSNTISKGTFSSTGTSTLNGLTNLGNVTTAGSSSIGTTFTVTGASVLTGGITTPTVTGGTTTTSALNLQATSGNGTTSAAGINFLVGNNGATTGGIIYNDGTWNIGNKANTTQGLARFGQGTGWLDIVALPGATNYMSLHYGQLTPTTTSYGSASNGTDMLINAPTTTGVLSFRNSNNARYNIQDAKNTWSPGTATTGVVNIYLFNRPDNTGSTASTECAGFAVIASGTGFRQWLVGNIATQRENYFQAIQYRATGASTITNAYGLFADQSTAGASITITNNWGIGTNGNGLITGSLVVGRTAGTPSAILDVTGTGSVSGTFVSGNHSVPHIIGNSTAPTIVSGSGLGTGAGTVVSVTRATDMSGIIGVVTGTASLGTSAVLATLTFNVAYGVAPNVAFTPANANAVNLQGTPGVAVYPSTSTTTMNVNTNTVALSAGTTYSFFYTVFQ